MNNFFIYQYNFKEDTTEGESVDISSTVIFCESEEIKVNTLQAEINEFYERHSQTEKVFVFGGEYLRSQMYTAFVDRQEETFRYVPKRDLLHLKDNIHIYSFDETARLNPINEPYKNVDIFDALFNHGMVYIFIKRGGLIESKEAHHFVFPSGKHSNKFLRTGNILLHSSEIYFIAFRLLSSFDPSNTQQIYCDTSSINSLAFALQDLKRKILHKKAVSFTMLSVESFSSYEGLYKGNGIHLPNSLILISASTSAKIMERIMKAHPLVRKTSMRILFFLGGEAGYRENSDQIICNLTRSDVNTEGIDLYRTYMESDCALCENGSFPVKINGDVFLSESPRINRLTLVKNDAPKFLSGFVKQFMSKNCDTLHVLKVNYKETSKDGLQYEIYIDVDAVIERIKGDKTPYPKFKDKLNDYINQYIPTTTRYLICLPDEGSLSLARYILQQIGYRYAPEQIPKIVSQDEIGLIDEAEHGAAIVIASCIANGKNLLYLSRALRKCNHLKLIYFVGILRMTNKETLDFLKSNLKQGIYGGETNSFHAVENIFCNNDVLNTSWTREIRFLKKFRDFAEDISASDAIITTVDTRIALLEESMSRERRGLANALFYHSIFDRKELGLRKNYAFLNFDNYYNNVSQSDVYFTISIILNHLRHNKEEEHHITQSEYVRTLIDPGNFSRFNDGIIQASILRGAYSQELTYHIDLDASAEMRGILETIITYQKSEQGEALLEFLYAIADKKLSLKDDHLDSICRLIKEKVQDTLALLFCEYIEKNILQDYYRYMSLEEENKILKEKLAALQTPMAVPVQSPPPNIA